MDEFEKLLKDRMDDAINREYAARACDECGCIMLDSHRAHGTMWCSCCGKVKDASQS